MAERVAGAAAAWSVTAPGVAVQAAHPLCLHGNEDWFGRPRAQVMSAVCAQPD